MSQKFICLLIISCIFTSFSFVSANTTSKKMSADSTLECKSCQGSIGGEVNCTSIKCPEIPASFDKFAGSKQGKEIIGILSKVKNTEDYPDTIIENENVLKAMSLFIHLPGIGNLSKANMAWLFRYFTIKANWGKDMSFGVLMNRINGDLYLVNIYTAGSTQPSSFYVFYDSSYKKIATGKNGIICMTEYRVSGNDLGVIYCRCNETHPEKDFALLEKEKGEWVVRWNSYYESEWISADGDVEFFGDDLSLLKVTGSCFGLDRVEETVRDKILAKIDRQDIETCFTGIWERKGDTFIRRSKLPAGSSLYEKLKEEMVD